MKGLYRRAARTERKSPPSAKQRGAIAIARKREREWGGKKKGLSKMPTKRGTAGKDPEENLGTSAPVRVNNMNKLFLTDSE